MELQEYLEKKKTIQHNLLDFLEKDDDTEENYQNLIKLISDQKITKDRQELKSFLYLISKISNNHHRTINLFDKIEKIIQFLVNQIKQTFSNDEIFDIFKNNKKILLFLIEQKIIKVDKSISSIMVLPKYEKLNYPSFFLNEIKKNGKNPKIKQLNKEIIENLDEKRKICANDSIICEIIRKDSIDDFTSFISKEKVPLSSKIERSIFETNPFLMKNDPTLIEYAAFYGSIQIFKYLQQNNVELSKKLWLYSIHSQNFELINFLVNNHVEPEDNTYEECLKEAIKCHHIDIAIYIKDNLIPREEDPKGGEPRISRNIKQDIYSSAIRYYNYMFFENYFQNKLCFVRFCQYGYYKIVELTLKNYEMNVNYFVVFFLGL